MMKYTFDRFIDDIYLLSTGNYDGRTIPKELSPLCILAFGFDYRLKYSELNFGNFEYEFLPFDNKERSVSIAFSGGLKSLAIATLYLDMGYNVKGHYLNTASSEDNITKGLAFRMSLGLRVFDEDLTDSHHMFKLVRIINNIVLDDLIKYGTARTIGIGYLPDMTFENCNEETLPYTIEVIEAYENVLSKFFQSKFTLKRPFNDEAMMWDRLLENPKWISATNTDSLRRTIILADHNVRKATYGEYRIILTKLMEGDPECEGNIKKFWKRNFFYSIKKSKYYDKLMKRPVVN